MDITRVRSAVAAGLPGYRVETVAALGAGQDNVAFEVNGELVVRFAKQPRDLPVEREARLLAAVAAVAPVPVPEPVFVDAGAGCLAYRKLTGTPLTDLPRERWRGRVPALGAVLGGLLRALHAVPADAVAGLAEVDDEPLREWLREAREVYPAVAGTLAQPYRGRVETFLRTAPPPRSGAPVFSHNDLSGEHVFVDPDSWTVTGVIDWTDAALVDPAYDYGLIYRDLGPDGLRAADPEPGLVDRAIFYARCSLLEDLAYGLETGQDRYTATMLSCLEWVYGA